LHESDHSVATAIDSLAYNFVALEPRLAKASEEIVSVFDVQPQNFLHGRKSDQLAGISGYPVRGVHEGFVEDYVGVVVHRRVLLCQFVLWVTSFGVVAAFGWFAGSGEGNILSSGMILVNKNLLQSLTGVLGGWNDAQEGV
jgi:hypothetical protein